jgi:hypothetical protein
MSPDEVAEGLRQRAEILALLDAPTRATLEAEALGGHDEQLEMIGHVLFFLNVNGGTPAQLAELINRRYRGVHDIRRTADVALGIARGEETTAARTERETREAEERREFAEQARARLDDDDDAVPEVSTTH